LRAFIVEVGIEFDVCPMAYQPDVEQSVRKFNISTPYTTSNSPQT